MSVEMQQRICIGPKVSQNSENPISILLPNPSSGLPSRYIIQEGRLFEMQVVDTEGLRSWFVGDTVQSDGSLYITTPIDPVFMFIPILDIMRQKTIDSEGRFLTIDTIFESDQYTSLRHLSQLHKIELSLALVCEVRGSSIMKTFRLDDDKTMKWLKQKVELIVNKFESVPALVESIAYTESLPEVCRKEAIVQSALRLVSAYLSDSWDAKLAAEYQFPELDKMQSRTQLLSISDFGKRSGMDLDEDFKADKEIKKPKMSVGQKKLAKASAGMKPISSFFAKKTA
ncbi:Ribonuclease H2 subunit B [Lobosporangium transversale]|uniref:Ribonuclease H2 subunit B n=1 Tax=Lobosporangium transversale TaxID=64571 RepID=A0A1Y2GP39_9FUNG|nr:ribonuclease H2, subunit B [Lobosporangium transversale]KAF9914457.1 Ribonuclease H2 subunit B [Lobosporangium transversale]ORZ16818.1 ribonuclease H2, subunit B [Lobosporangium transversale]|eukprot:XP_021881753.1 ribonuclease H2, subunit B [Lobosporangium transversale]